MDSLLRGVPLLGGMGVEAVILRRKSVALGTSAFDYEPFDTLASVNPLRVVARLAVPAALPVFSYRRGRLGRTALATGVAAAVVTTASDWIGRRLERTPAKRQHSASSRSTDRPPLTELSRGVSAAGGTTAVALVGAVACATWTDATSDAFFWKFRIAKGKHNSRLVLVSAVLAWDFVYYWNHRMMHSHRALWAIHGVHHSSERFNFSTAIRQPVTDRLGICIPYGVLCLFGVPPATLTRARDINLGYQWFLHTGLVPHLGVVDRVVNTPSNHRVHHALNDHYLDRNLGSVSVIWDRLFGTYEAEVEPVVYGSETSTGGYNPFRLMYGGQAQMLRDIYHSRTWRDRLRHVFAGPAWAQAHRAPE